MIIFNKVSKKFKDGSVVLDDISFSVDKGEFVFMIGPCGAGKTTISRLLIREVLPSRGKIFIDHEDITQVKKKHIPLLRRKIGTAFQDFKILPDRTVRENIALALEITNKKEKEVQEKVEKLLSLVGLVNKGDYFPAELSGGELQRVVIARALVHDPKVLFADEPTGNLDPDTAWQIIDLLKTINQKGTTVIVATHNASIVDNLSQRVIRLEKGRIKEDKKEGKYKESVKHEKEKHEEKDKIKVKKNPPAGGPKNKEKDVKE